MKNAGNQAHKLYQKKWTRHDLERLENRQMLSADAVQSLPFRLDFNQNLASTIVDKDGQGTGFTRIQANKFGTEYQQNLIDLDVNNQGVLRLTTTGTSSAGSNAGTDNTQTNALETQFDGTTSGFTITARLLGNGSGVGLNYLNDVYEQAGIYFGPDQDNYVKLVVIRSDAGQVLQFKEELDGGNRIADSATRFNIGSFSSINTLDLRIVGDAATGKITAFYAINGASFQKLSLEYTLPTAKTGAFFNSAARTGLLTSHKNNVGPITATFDSFEILAGESLADRPSVSGTRPGNGTINVSRDSFIAADVILPTSGGGIDTATLNNTNVRLYRQSDGQSVIGVINTSGGGDAIVFQPTSALAANTTYVFEVTTGVKDTTGKSFIPYSSTFTTGTQGATIDTNVSFTKTAQTATQGVRHTSAVFGPDGKLYTTTIDGKIIRYDVAANGTLGGKTEILTIQNREGGRRSVMSIVFDPASTANNLIAYVSHSDFAGLELKEYESENLGAASNWTGKITRLTGSSLQNGQDIVTGLPRSVRDHQNYQMSFGPDGRLYISQSSQSAMGRPDNAWGNKPETLLSASILQIDVAAIGSGTVNARTEGLGANNYNPYAANAPVKIYATGLRSAYDVLWHSNGYLYSATNGSAAGGNTPAGGGVPQLTGVSTQNDYMFRVLPGKYYGHPNPLRNEFVLNGGNPTNGTDPGQVSEYPVGTQPDANWGGFIYDYGKNYSPNGMIEYKSNTFDGKLKGSIIGVRYSGGDDLIVMDMAANGGISAVHTNYVGLSGFVNPLDVVEDPTTGNLYVIEFGDQGVIPDSSARITLLTAQAGNTPAGVAAASLSRGKVYFSDQTNSTGSSLAQNVRLTNTGNGPMTITGLSMTGSNASEFTVRDAFGNVISTPIVLQAGERMDFYITFRTTTVGIRTGTFNITTDIGIQTVALRGLGVAGTGGTLEPSLQRILDLYQIGVNVGDNDPATTDFPVDTATSADEVTAPRLVKAGSGPVTVEVLGVFANQVSRTTFGWYEAGNPQSKYIVAKTNSANDNQSIAPLQEGQFTFDPGTGAFGIYSNFTLGSTNNPLNRDVYSEDVLNTWETNTNRQKKVRFYQLKDANGTVVPNAYVAAFEEYNLSFDQNDLVAIIRNVQPAANAPELGLENRDNAPAADELTMSRIQPSGWDPDLPNEFHDRSTLRIRNTGNQNLNITGTSINNADFIIESGGGARTLAPGQFVDVVVRFVYSSSSRGNLVRTATLTITSNDPDEATKTVTLRGAWQSHSEDAPGHGSQEPVLQKILDAFGYKVNAGNLNTNGNAVRAGEEILSELWQRADNGIAVGVVQLAAYHQQHNIEFNTATTISWYNPNNIGSSGKPTATKIFTHAQVDSQSLLPRIDGSTTQLAQGTFNPRTVTQFGFKVDGVYSTDVYNTPNDKGNAGHGIRFYQAKDSDGNIIPDAYILAQDYVGVSFANYDYQDNVYLLTNVRPVNAPLAPTGLIATGSSSGITLDWANNPEGNVTGYRVYRATSSGGTYELIAETTASAYVDGTAPGNATSFYKVAAITYQNQESAQSLVASAFRSGTAGSAPSAPSGAVATANSATQVTLNWTDNSNNETGFIIERRTGNGAWAVLNTVGANVSSFVDSTVSASTSFTYRVVATNASGNSLASNEAAVTTPASQPGETSLTSTDIGNPTPAASVTTLTAGKDFNVTVGGADIWGTYDSFNFLHEQRTGDFDVKVRLTGLTAIDSSTMAGLMARETLATGSKHVNIKIRPSGFRLNYRPTTNGTTLASGTGAADLSNAYVRLQRVGNTFNTFTSTDGVNWTAFQSINVTMGSTIYVGLATAAKSNTQATTAQYRGYGDTNGSSTPTAPAAPTGLTANANSATSVALNWTDNASNESGFIVERRIGSGAWAQIATLGANATSYTDTTASASTSYTYRVFATGAANSATSNEASVTTPANPNPGSNTTLTSVADGYVLGGTPTTNYGSSTTIDVKTAGSSTTRFGYIRFDLASLAGQDLNTVTLRLYGASSQAGTSLDIRVFGAGNGWSESTLNFNNRPAATTGALGTINVSTAQWHEVDVSNHVKAAIAGGATSITFMLGGVVSTSPFAKFDSREAGATAPQLAVTINGGATPQVPTAASNVVATANSQTSVGLTWNDSADNETGFRVERRTGSGAYVTVGTVGSNVTTFTDTTASANTTYTYRVIAFNATGDASASNESTVTTPANPANNTTLTSVADTFARGGTDANTNFADAQWLQTKFSSQASFNRTTYIRFDISSLTSVTNVKLRLYADLNTADSVQIGAWAVGGAWNESTLTFNTQPGKTGSAIATATVTSTTGEWVEMDVTAFVQQAIAAGRTSVDFAIDGTRSSTAFVAIASRESGATSPQLVVT